MSLPPPPTPYRVALASSALQSLGALGTARVDALYQALLGLAARGSVLRAVASEDDLRVRRSQADGVDFTYQYDDARRVLRLLWAQPGPCVGEACQGVCAPQRPAP